MKPVGLIAFNFVREQRWPILVLLLWVLLLAFLGLAEPNSREDLLLIFKLVGAYVVVFSIFFGGSAIYNERRSRRILAVLAKAVSRQQYLSGLVLGVTLASVIYCFALGLTGSWTLGGVGFPISRVWFLMLCLVSACTLAGTVALTFSTFLNPFFAAGATALVLILPAIIGHIFSARWSNIIPVYTLAAAVLDSSFAPSPVNLWVPLGWSIVETIAFWLIAARIFARVDIAVSVE
jgi:ABC-type transport system involved in multi-copper enzyme maturation permease subunit